MTTQRPAAIHHCTSHPLHFFGREAELALLDHALAGEEPSVAAMIGPGGQGKTAIAQHWLSRLLPSPLAEKGSGVRRSCDGLFLWSFYRGRDSDLCLREMLAYAEGLDQPPDVSASWCVDRLLRVLQTERWAVVLDGAEIVQHEQGAWFGRFVHPELGRLLEELASVLIPGVVVLTSRFPMPTLANRRHAKLLSLRTLDIASGVALLESLGVHGDRATLAEAAQSCGLHAKAVELLGTYLVRYRGGRGEAAGSRHEIAGNSRSDEEVHVAGVLQLLESAMSAELKDILALATSFRQPTTEVRLREYLRSEPVRHLMHDAWGRTYLPFPSRAAGWVEEQIQTLVDLRLLERVHSGRGNELVIDAHPLVRTGFEHLLGGSPSSQTSLLQGTRGGEAGTRAGFLRGRPDRRPPHSLEEAHDEVELFHAYADAGLWNEADSTLVSLDNPKHRFLAPAFERDLLLRFFPSGDWRQSSLWPGFGRRRSLAICFEMLGQFEEAIAAYPPADVALRGDALLALGRLQPFLNQPQAEAPWQTLWQAYRAHALALLGRNDEAMRVAQSIIPTDIYEWVHVFECLLRLGRLDAIDLGSVLYRPPFAQESRFTQLARERMRLDYIRLVKPQDERNVSWGSEYRALIEAYDRGGLPFERVLTRLGYARWLERQQKDTEAGAIVAAALELCQRFGMRVLELDCLRFHESGCSRP